MNCSGLASRVVPQESLLHQFHQLLHREHQFPPAITRFVARGQVDGLPHHGLIALGQRPVRVLISRSFQQPRHPGGQLLDPANEAQRLGLGEAALQHFFKHAAFELPAHRRPIKVDAALPVRLKGGARLRETMVLALSPNGQTAGRQADGIIGGFQLYVGEEDAVAAQAALQAKGVGMMIGNFGHTAIFTDQQFKGTFSRRDASYAHIALTRTILVTMHDFQLTAPRTLGTRSLLAGLLLTTILCQHEASARNFRVSMLPNGSVFSCNTCHTSGGGTPRNPFGLAVQARVTPNGMQAFWDASLAGQDSDGDGFTNGQELGDPDGDGIATPGATITNPGDASSKPNRAPGFSSSPGTAATEGILYSYQASAIDLDGDSLTFSKFSGPTWISVASGGAVTGTPTAGSAGSVPITIRVTDNGNPALSADQSYTLIVAASFASWQGQNFNLPAENAIASPNLDPDNDGLPNLVEYALKTLPKQANAIKLMSNRTFNGSGQLQFSQVIRDDDPKLSVKFEAAAAVPLASPTLINAVLTDPTPGDGLKTWTFTDTVSKNNTATRFGRLRFEILP